jgi:fructokinase
MGERPLMVGIGEVLWDILPTGSVLGGAPANFAYMANTLGNEGVVASRLGNDHRGHDARRMMRLLGLNLKYVQEDDEHGTGTADVTLDAGGQPQFVIRSPAAWDFLQWVPQWEELAKRADVVCFGSLAQRSPISANTIERFLQCTPSSTVRICDANLREPFYTVESLRRLFTRADLLKVNDQELQRIGALMEISANGEDNIAKKLLGAFDLQLVCITRGKRGSLLVSGDEVVQHSGFPVQVSDAIGAGDAFTACLAHDYIRGKSLEEISERANRFGSWVATQTGATPAISEAELRGVLNGQRPEVNADSRPNEAAAPANRGNCQADGTEVSE